MSLAPWRSPLARALHLSRSQPQARYLQLATISPQGFPTNRTVVFRGFFEDTNQLKIITDSRSEKIAHLTYFPWAEACWYFSKTREQFRLKCQVTIVKSTDTEKNLTKERILTWQSLSDAARWQFAWAHPGKPRGENISDVDSDAISNTEPLDNFYLLLLNPQQVDYLKLRGEPQNRYLYELTEENMWKTTEVNP